MITADTITDEQIRDLESRALERLCGIDTAAANKKRWAALDLATLALSEAIDWSRVRSGEIDVAVANDHNRRRREARTRCAEILNAWLDTEIASCECWWLLDPNGEHAGFCPARCP